MRATLNLHLLERDSDALKKIHQNSLNPNTSCGPMPQTPSWRRKTRTSSLKNIAESARNHVLFEAKHKCPHTAQPLPPELTAAGREGLGSNTAMQFAMPKKRSENRGSHFATLGELTSADRALGK